VDRRRRPWLEVTFCPGTVTLCPHDVFEVRADGLVARELDLPGKPDPAVFLLAARWLGVTTLRTVVVEDALAGVEAGRAGSVPGDLHYLGTNLAGCYNRLRDEVDGRSIENESLFKRSQGWFAVSNLIPSLAWR
jgi:hypothetical protein